VSSRPAETTLLRPTLLGLLRLGWVSQMTPAETEVRWHQKRIDLAFVSSMPAVGCVAVELKVDNWASVLRQARLNRILSPSSWVATPNVSELQERRARSLGVGILLVTARGVYPVLYPARDAGREQILIDAISARGRRIRDLLGETLRAG